MGWELEEVEKPLVEQLQGMGWTHMAGSLDVPAATGRTSFTAVPRMPPGTSSAPTKVASSVRAQQHSKPPQPLLTVLPSVTATGR